MDGPLIKRPLIRRLAALASAVLVTSTAQSTIVQVEGDDLIFTYDDSTYFGTAMLNGNSLFFLPTEFQVASANTDGFQEVTDTLNIGIDVKAGSTFDIGGLQQYIAGDYMMTGSTSAVSVSGSLMLDSHTSDNTTTLNYTADQLNVVGALTEWSSLNTIELSDFTDWGSDSSLSLSYSSTMSASSHALGDSAFIQQKVSAVGFQVIAALDPDDESEPVEVVEPSTLILLSMGMLALFMVRKPKR